MFRDKVSTSFRFTHPLSLEDLMKANVGSLDRAMRVIAGIILIALTLSGVIGPWGWLGLIAIATGVFRFCPAYAVLGMSSCKLAAPDQPPTA